MAKRQQTPKDMDETNLDMDEEETEDREDRGRFTNEGGHENLDDEDIDTGAKPTPAKKK